MVFKEKTAWIMSVALILGGLFYWRVVVTGSAGIEAVMPPLLPVVVIYVFILVLIAIFGHAIAALMNPAAANTPADEREKAITARGGAAAQVVLGVGILLSLGMYLLSYDGHALFHWVFGSLMLSQLTEYVTQIFLFRKSMFGASA